MMKKIFILFLFSAFLIKAQVEIPVLPNYANDLTGTLNNSELYTLNSSLKRFDDSTSNQVIFLMIPSLQGYSLESFTNETAAKNNIGSKKNNNGVLFFVSKNDRKMRIEVGYGLEGALPDALANSILRNEVSPYFKEGDYSSGIAAGLNAIMAATKGEYQGEQKGTRERGGRGFPFFLIFILIAIISSIFRRGGRGGGSGILPWIILGSLGGNRGSGGWGGGGFGGSGGFGGFSGGGGSFGGGGASGGW